MYVTKQCQYYSVIEKYEMGGECGTNGNEENGFKHLVRRPVGT